MIDGIVARVCQCRFPAVGWALAVTLAVQQPANATVTLHVDDDAGSNGDGLSWNSAYKYLNDALAFAAVPAHGVTEIRVAQGVYRAGATQNNPLTLDRNSRFQLVNGVVMMGGYVGLAAQKGQSSDERDYAKYPSILTGDLLGNDTPDMTFAGNDENAFQVVVAVNVDESAVLDGFVITGGRADGVSLGATPESRDQGSGVNIYFASPTIINCTFRLNWSINHGTINDHGDKTNVINCVFEENYSDDFGASLYVHHHSMTAAVGCEFRGNVAVNQGAGFYSRSMMGAMLVDCSFIENVALEGAGAYLNADSNTMIMNCSFVQNSAHTGAGVYSFLGNTTVLDSMFCNNTATTSSGEGGGGMWNVGGVHTIDNCLYAGNIGLFGAGIYNGDDCLPTITNCQFINNVGSEGVGIYNIASNSIISDCIFNSNIAQDTKFAVGGGVSNYFCDPVITRCSFTGNSAQFGGGAVYGEGDRAVFANCTFTHNVAEGNYGWGGAMLHSFTSETTVANCLFQGNRGEVGGAAMFMYFCLPTHVNCTYIGNASQRGGGALHALDDSNASIHNAVIWSNALPQVDGQAIDITYSCVEGGHAGVGNIDDIPLFISEPSPGADGLWGSQDDDYGNVRLQPGSPCIDAGDNTVVPALAGIDLDGNARFVDDPDTSDSGNTDGKHPIVDMGPFEFPAPVPCVGDIAPDGGDGVVNVDDLLLVISNWGSAGGDGPADIDLNGVVNVDDLLAVISAWGPCG